MTDSPLNAPHPPILDGAEAARLAAEHGTPFYLYDMDAALAHLATLKAALGARVDVLYCMKANGNRGVLDAFRPEVAGLDISSAGELDMATQAGWSAKLMSFAGPGKTTAELRKALSAGLGILSLESLAELGRAAEVAKSLGITQAVTLRINPASMPKEFAMKMGGGASQFGIAEEEADAAVTAILAEKAVKLVGLHIFAGTQCLEESAVVENLRGTLAIFARLADRHDLHPEKANLGGGFGIPYFAGQSAMAADSLGRAVAAELERFVAAHPRFARTRFVVELGRYLIGAFGVYVARVTEIKETRGKRFLILDGGMHHAFPATGNFGQLVKKNYPVENLSRGGALAQEAEAVVQEICGPLCTPMDSMARAAKLPPGQPGDLIGFFQSGAYSFAASPLLFLSHDTPLELVRHRGKVTPTRSRMPSTRFAT